MPKIKLRLAHSAGKVSTSSSATASSTLPTNTRLLNVEANDVACSVDGCGVIDINQRLVPFWRRRVTACITSDDINATTSSRSSTSSAVPEHWSIRRQQGHSDHRQVSGTSSSGSSEATATPFVRLFPICAGHERERREWQAAHGAPPRLSGPLARLVDAYDEAAKPPPSGNVKVDPGARRAARSRRGAQALQRGRRRGPRASDRRASRGPGDGHVAPLPSFPSRGCPGKYMCPADVYLRFAEAHAEA